MFFFSFIDIEKKMFFFEWAPPGPLEAVGPRKNSRVSPPVNGPAHRSSYLFGASRAAASVEAVLNHKDDFLTILDIREGPSCQRQMNHRTLSIPGPNIQWKQEENKDC